MNTQGKRANFSPYQEKSNANENSENYCRKHAHDWGSCQHRRGPQQITTAFTRSAMLRIAGTRMPRQPRLPGPKQIANPKRVQ